MPVERLNESARLLELLDRVLDKGIVIDAWVRVSLVGLDLLTVDVRLIVASIDTYVTHVVSADQGIGRDSPDAGPAPPRARRPRLAGRVFLLVEDHEDSREALKALLEFEGARVLPAADGSGALAQLDTLGSPPDLLLIDLGLPGMDGFELLAAVHRHAAWARVPAIAVTARMMPADYHATLEAGFEAHVHKPVDQEGLIRAIRRALRLPPGPARGRAGRAAGRRRFRKVA